MLTGCADRIVSNFSAVVFGSLLARAKTLPLVVLGLRAMEYIALSCVPLRSVLSSND